MKTIDVILYTLQDTGYKDKTNRPIMRETPVTVKNVLFFPISSDDVTNETNLSGKKELYNVSIPKGDTNNWIDAKVDINGIMYQTVGTPLVGIEANIPGKYKGYIKVERYE